MAMYERPDLYLADCMTAMKEFPDKFFDLAIVDPPYGGVTKGGYMKNSATGLAAVQNYHLALWECPKPSKEYFTELMRVSKNQVIWGGNYFASMLPDSQCWLVWDKKHPEGVHFADCELAWTSFNLASRIFHYLWNGMIQQNMADKQIRIHPTEKPISLYQWILDKYTEKGQKILDTHAGSASSLIACHRAGLDAWGFEIDKEYYTKAKERLDREKAQSNMFEML